MDNRLLITDQDFATKLKYMIAIEVAILHPAHNDTVKCGLVDIISSAIISHSRHFLNEQNWLVILIEAWKHINPWPT